MAEYIEREKLYNNLILLAKYETGERQQGILGCAETVRIFSAADVAPVVHCKDCERAYEDIDGLTCIYGPCVDCAVPEDFYCKYGEREEE